MGGITDNNERIVLKYEETIHQQRIPSGQGLIGATPYWVQATTALLGIIGTNNANGTEVLEIEIPAGHVFVCSILHFSCNEARTIKVCTVADAQVLGHASEAEIFTLGSSLVGLHAIKAEEQPIFIVDNSASAVAIDMLLYAPHTVFNIVNDPVTSYFEAFFGGLLYRGNVALKGTV
jgi:hypothetical protein